MANDQYDDKFEGHEESEYHFSDDQINYEMDPEVGNTTTAAPAASSRENVMQKIKQSPRRMMVGIVIFIFLLSFIYKLLVPAPETTPNPAFAQSTPTSQKVAKPASKPALPASAVIATGSQVETDLSSTQQPTPNPMPTQAVQPSATPALTVQAAPPVVAAGQQPVAANSPVVAPVNPQDRLSSLEQQNAAIMNILQTQYAQKMAEYETENSQMRNQIQELNSRISSMEVAFRQLTKILRSMRTADAGASNASPSSSGMANSRANQPKVGYTVQAIIPGRAWLKADSGDTVTVAEGDVLRDYGRITKIDPYDGVVNIDTGNKVITLSYGASGD